MEGKDWVARVMIEDWDQGHCVWMGVGSGTRDLYGRGE